MDTAKRCPEDFVFHRIIGEGSFSMVYLARDVQTKYLCAVKVCEKSHIHREKMRKAIFREKQIMKYLTEKQSKFIIKLLSTFQDDTRLYFVLNYCVNGELLSFINQREIFDHQATLFYAGEILVALEHLHRLDIVHRDLKPENILLNEKMHIQITDFGSAFFLNDPTGEKNDPFETTKYSYHRSRKNTFVGTAQYVSPEMLSNKKITGMCDIWAWACMLFQMIAATPPFSGGNEYSIFQKIQNLDYKFNEQFPDDAKELIKLILKIDPQDRLGSTDDVNDVENGYKSIRNHRFFQSLNNDWNFLNKKPPEKLLSVARNEQSLDELCAEFDQMNLTTGLNEKQMTRLLCLSLHQESDSFKSSSSSSSATAAANNCDNKNNQQQHQQQQQQRKHIMDISKSEFDERIRRQKETNKFHQFVENNLIIKQGLIDKKKGLIPRRRMFLLTTGPHLYYVDPANMILKGEVPFGKDMRTEAKNFRNFYIHVPNRTYILEDITNNAPGWCEIIDNVNKYALQQQDQQQQSTNKTTDNCTNDRQLQQNNGCNNQSNQNNSNNSSYNSNNSINNNNNPSNTNTTNNSNVKKSRNSIFNLNIKKITSSSSSSSSSSNSSSSNSSSNTSNTNQSSSSANHSLLNQQQHHQQQQQSNNNNNNNSNTSSSSSSIAANNNN